MGQAWLTREKAGPAALLRTGRNRQPISERLGLQKPGKAAVLEEFLHGTQFRLGLIDRLSPAGAEAHVKDFMIRHQSLLGLGPEDVHILKVLRERDLKVL